MQNNGSKDNQGKKAPEEQNLTEIKRMLCDDDGHVVAPTLKNKIATLQDVFSVLRDNDYGLFADDLVRETLDPHALEDVELDEDDKRRLVELEAEFRASLDAPPIDPKSELSAAGIDVVTDDFGTRRMRVEFVETVQRILSRAFGNDASFSPIRGALEDTLCEAARDLYFLPQGWLASRTGKTGIMFLQRFSSSKVPPTVSVVRRGRAVDFEVMAFPDRNEFCVQFSEEDFSRFEVFGTAGTGMTIELDP